MFGGGCQSLPHYECDYNMNELRSIYAYGRGSLEKKHTRSRSFPGSFVVSVLKIYRMRAITVEITNMCQANHESSFGVQPGTYMFWSMGSASSRFQCV